MATDDQFLSKVHVYYRKFMFERLVFKQSSTTVRQIPSHPSAHVFAAGRGFLLRSHVGDFEMAKFRKLIKNTKGATAIEYGLIAALIAVAAIGAMQGIGNKLNSTFNNVSNSLN